MLFLPSKLDSDSRLSKHFLPYQVAWIQAEKAIHKQRKQAVALAEKSVRIGWTYADAFKNVRKRLWFKNRDYLFATKDYPSALEYVRQCYKFAEIFNLTRSITSHGEESLAVNRLDEHGRPSSFTEDLKVGVIKFDNGSRIIAFSANPQAMAVYGGDVGLDEFAKHPNARLLWETAQGRVTWNYDIAIWSSHDGEDTLFNEFAQEARHCSAGLQPAVSQTSSLQPPAAPNASSNSCKADSLSASCEADVRRGEGQGEVAFSIQNPESRFQHPDSQTSTLNSPSINCPWNIYFRVTLPDAIQNGLVAAINRVRGTKISPTQFLADCRARARDEGIFEQAYMCNPLGATANRIVEWSAIESCRYNYDIIRLHLEHNQILEQFGQFNPATQDSREYEITQFIHKRFLKIFQTKSQWRLGFDVAASGQGDLAVIYLDEVQGSELWLRALFTCRTEDWHFLSTVLFKFLSELRYVEAAGDASGLGRQICWDAASHFGSRFIPVNFGSKKHDLGFALMQQLSTAQKRFPRSEQDIASDFFALRKHYQSTRWVFSEGANTLNPISHCDIAWAGALATHAHTERKFSAGGMVC